MLAFLYRDCISAKVTYNMQKNDLKLGKNYLKWDFPLGGLLRAKNFR